MQQAQSGRKLNVWQTCREIAEKSSKIVPPGAPVYLHSGVVRSCEKDPTLRSAKDGPPSRRILSLL